VEIKALNCDRSLPTVPTTQIQHSHRPNDQINTVLGYIAVALPIVLVLSIVGYRRYRTHLVKRQIAKLERMWRLSPQGKI
jgi:hypothetical protein